MPLFDNFPGKLIQNVHWEEKEMDGSKFIRACIAEMIALMFFVVLCCGGAMTTLHSAHPNMMEIASSFGFGIMVIAQFIGPLSGGHINCAVSFALFLGGRISGKRLVCYTAFQMMGAVLGAAFLRAIFPTDYLGENQNFGSNEWDPAVFNAGQVFLAEMWGTAILVYNVFATIDHPVEGGGALGVMPIAMSVMVAHLFLIPIDGCSINPTRSFGPFLVASLMGSQGNFINQHYMFWLGPMMGAAVAAIIYEYGSLKPKKREGGGDLASRLHMSKATRHDADAAHHAHQRNGGHVPLHDADAVEQYDQDNHVELSNMHHQAAVQQKVHAAAAPVAQVHSRAPTVTSHSSSSTVQGFSKVRETDSYIYEDGDDVESPMQQHQL